MLGWNVDLGFDVGTSTTRLYQRGVGLVASEPTAVAFTTASGEVAAFGAEAKLLGEQASSGVRVVFPVRAGVVADHQATTELLRGMMRRVLGRRALFLPRALVALNTDATPVDRAALQHAVQSAGAREVRMVDGTLAGAVGAGLVATDRSARLVVGLGGGSTTFGLVAQGRLVWGRSLRFGRRGPRRGGAEADAQSLRAGHLRPHRGTHEAAGRRRLLPDGAHEGDVGRE